jgi:transporter family-2 protein
VQAVTARRLAGVALAIVAVLVSALAGGTGNPHVGLLVLVALAGLGVAFQQAANGRLQQASGETIFAAVVNFLLGTLLLGLLVLVTRPHLTSLTAPVPLYAGGLLGAGFVLTAAATVRVLGVLRLSLVAIAGQSAGSLVLDGLDPAPGRHLGLATVLGVVLTVVAVAISRTPARPSATKP